MSALKNAVMVAAMVALILIGAALGMEVKDE